MELLLIGLLLIVFGVWGLGKISQSENNKVLEEAEKIRDKTNPTGKRVYSSFVEYCGGHPDLISYGLYNIDIYEDKIILYGGRYSKGNQGKMVTLNSSDILRVNLEDHTQIVNNPKFSSVLIFGVAGLALGNREISQLYYITIDYRYKGNVITIILGSDIKKHEGTILPYVTEMDDRKRTTEIISYINSVIPSKNRHEDIVEQDGTNIANQIRQLSRLCDEGILTEDEFNQKKKVLLDRIS